MKFLFLFLLGMGWVNPVMGEEMKMIKIVALGDSTTAGTPYALSPLEDPPAGSGDFEASYPYWVKKKFPEAEVLNQGIRGQRTDQIFKRYSAWIETHPTDLVIVMAGVNDLYQGASVLSVKKNLQDIYDVSDAKGIKVMAMTILPFNEATADISKKISEANDWVRSTANERNYLFLDAYKLLESPKASGKLAGTEDGVHPDEAGYKKLGQEVAEYLQKNLQEVV